LEQLGLHPEKVTLGEVILAEGNLSIATLEKVDGALQAHGFERIDDRKSRLIEAIKTKIIHLISP